MADNNNILEQKIWNPQASGNEDKWFTPLTIDNNKQIHLNGFLDTEKAVNNFNINDNAISSEKIQENSIEAKHINEEMIQLNEIQRIDKNQLINMGWKNPPNSITIHGMKINFSIKTS